MGGLFWCFVAGLLLMMVGLFLAEKWDGAKGILIIAAILLGIALLSSLQLQ